MGLLLIILKLMPTSIETNLKNIEEHAREIAGKFNYTIIGFDQEPIAFGLTALIMKLSIDETTQDLDAMQEALRNIIGMASVEIIDMRRGLG